MKTLIRILVVPVIALVLGWSNASAQLINGRLIGSFSTFEKFDTVGVSKKFVRGFQSALFDVSYADVSLHTHVQVAGNLQSKLDEVPDYRFYYLYGTWRNILRAAEFSFGRMPYFAGVGNGTLDGGLLSIRLAENMVKLTLYGGQTTPIEYELKDWKKLKNNFTVGGQVLVTALDNTRIGVSYVHRHRERAGYWATREDSLLNPMQVYVVPTMAREQYLSGDVSYRYDQYSVYGLYDYDLNFNKTQRTQFGVRLGLTNELNVSADYIHREPRIVYNSFFSLFDLKAIDEFEVGGDYFVRPDYRAFARVAYVKYSGDKSMRYTAGVAHRYASLTYRGSSGYAGELTNLSVQALYPLLDGSVVPSVGIAFVSYKLDEWSKRENGFAGTVGAAIRPMQELSFDLQAQYLTNKIVKSDVRLFGKVNFWFTTQL